MSQQSAVQARSLTLTEELERLEQSITLTLQEIDHNFSRAHRIVTSSIIPIVEQYAKNSDAVWDGSKFWKQFFEASANVSLSSYEEPPEEDLTALSQQLDDRQSDYGTPSHVEGDATSKTAGGEPTSNTFDEDEEASSILDSPSVTVRYQRTPQLQTSGKSRAAQAEEASVDEYTSPYESLKQEIIGGQSHSRTTPKKQKAPETPGRNTQSSYEESSPIPIPPSTTQHLRRPNPDVLLHRVLDRNYRVQATPHTMRKTGVKATSKDQTQTTMQPSRVSALDSSPFSPSLEAPQLRSEIFGSPAARGPRTPGISIQRAGIQALRQQTTNSTSARKTLFPSQGKGNDSKRPTDLWSSDEEEDDLYLEGMSPPKTMQFHVPQSRLMQTPAREASKRIVEDLLMSAGVPGSITSEMGDLDLHDRWERQEPYQEEGSPSIVRGLRRDDEENEF